MKAIFTISLVILGLIGFWGDTTYCHESLSPEVTATNKKVSPIRFGGIRFKEIYEDGTFYRHVIKHRIYVVTSDSYKGKNKNKVDGKRRIKSVFKSRDVKVIDNILHLMFNGLNGKGTYSEEKELVYFDFDVKEWHIDENEYVTRKDLENIATDISLESGELLFDDYKGEEIYLRVPVHFLISSHLANTQGFNAGVITRINAKYQFNPNIYLHEILHQLLDRGANKEHRLGGGLSIPPGILTSKNVSAVLEDALISKNAVRTAVGK